MTSFLKKSIYTTVALLALPVYANEPVNQDATRYGVRVNGVHYYEQKRNGDKYMETNTAQVHVYHDINIVSFNENKTSLRLNSDVYLSGGQYKGSKFGSNADFGSMKTSIAGVGSSLHPYINHRVTNNTSVQLGVKGKHEYLSMNKRYNPSLSATIGATQEYKSKDFNLKYGASYEHTLINRYYYPNMQDFEKVWLPRDSSQKLTLFVEKDGQYGMDVSYGRSKEGKIKLTNKKDGSGQGRLYEPQDKEFGVGFYWNTQFN